jgi:hypothetical protein
MSPETTHRTEHTVELSAPTVDEIADVVAAKESPTPADVRDVAFDHLVRHTEFRAPSGELLADAVAARVE